MCVCVCVCVYVFRSEKVHYKVIDTFSILKKILCNIVGRWELRVCIIFTKYVKNIIEVVFTNIDINYQLNVFFRMDPSTFSFIIPASFPLFEAPIKHC